jgi:membrane protease YdiL (CAAX protease family)
LSPLLYWFGKGLLKAVHESGFCTYEDQSTHWLWSEVAKADFPRFFNRAVLLAAIVVMPFYVRQAGISRSLLPPIRPSNIDGWHFLLGFGIAAGLLLELGYLLVNREVYTLRPDAPWTGLFGPMLSAMTVAMLEEIIFRGFLLSLLLRSFSAATAVFWTTAIFTILHFLKPPDGLMTPDALVESGTGFWLIGQVLANFAKVDFFLAEFATLFAVGWVLAQARMITDRLWLAIGLHAGWVFGLKYFSALTRGSRPLRAGDYLPWLGENLRTGLVPCLVVLFTGWFVLQSAPLIGRNKRRSQELARGK